MPAMPIDASGRLHMPVAATDTVRIVSLVPSLTELLCDLGLQSQLVGRTGFCIHPRALLQSVAKVGGTKDVNIEKIRALAPTHLVVNIDENEKPTVELLSRFVPNVIVTHPQAPADNLQLYQLLGTLFGALAGVSQRAEALRVDFENAHAALLAGMSSQSLQRVLYCIWQDPWMTVSRQTYIGQMLALIGWQQWQPDPVLETAGEQAGSARYPVFAWSPALLAGIDCVLLSTEPYSFRQSHVQQLMQQTGKPVRLIDGEMLSWYGSRAIAGLGYLQGLRASAAD